MASFGQGFGLGFDIAEAAVHGGGAGPPIRTVPPILVPLPIYKTELSLVGQVAQTLLKKLDIKGVIAQRLLTELKIRGSVKDLLDQAVEIDAILDLLDDDERGSGK